MRSGTTSRLGVIVPCRNSLVTIRIPSSSVIACMKKPAPSMSVSTSSSGWKSVSALTRTTITRIRPSEISVRP